VKEDAKGRIGADVRQQGPDAEMDARLAVDK
jgi:hypothetical protein